MLYKKVIFSFLLMIFISQIALCAFGKKNSNNSISTDNTNIIAKIAELVKYEWEVIKSHLPDQLRGQLITAVASSAVYLIWDLLWNKIKKRLSGPEYSIECPPAHTIEKANKTEGDFAGNFPKEISDILELASVLPARVPRRILLYGPPGTGKTTIAQIIVHALRLKDFIQASGPAFRAQLEGQAPKKIIDMFEEARKLSSTSILPNVFKKNLNTGFDDPKKKVVIIIDEIDGAFEGAKKEGSNGQGSNIAQAMQSAFDRIEENEVIYVIGTTNYASQEHIPEAILDRFQRQIYIGLPDLSLRTYIINYYYNKHIFPEVNSSEIHDCFIKQIAENTENFSARSLKDLIEEIADQIILLKNKYKDQIAQLTILDISNKITQNHRNLLDHRQKRLNPLNCNKFSGFSTLKEIITENQIHAIEVEKETYKVPEKRANLHENRLK